MKRYRHYRGKIREHPTGQWVSFEDAHLLEVELRLVNHMRQGGSRVQYTPRSEPRRQGYYLDGEYVGPEWKDVVAAEAARLKDQATQSPQQGGLFD